MRRVGFRGSDVLQFHSKMSNPSQQAISNGVITICCPFLAKGLWFGLAVQVNVGWGSLDVSSLGIPGSSNCPASPGHIQYPPPPPPPCSEGKHPWRGCPRLEWLRLARNGSSSSSVAISPPTTVPLQVTGHDRSNSVFFMIAFHLTLVLYPSNAMLVVDDIVSNLVGLSNSCDTCS